jgi:hypothetical protein
MGMASAAMEKAELQFKTGITANREDVAIPKAEERARNNFNISDPFCASRADAQSLSDRLTQVAAAFSVSALNSVVPLAHADTMQNEHAVSDKKSPIFSLNFQLPLIPQGVVNAAAGFGDGISFGVTQWVREKLDVDHVVERTSNSYNAGLLAGIALPYARISYMATVGKEFQITKNLRIAPFGNRTGYDKKGNILMREGPHYHRRGPNQPNGETHPGQGIGRHRPWESSGTDHGFKDRF